MSKAAVKAQKKQGASSEVVSARLSKPKLSLLRKLYPGSSNQVIVEKLIEEKLARRDFDVWVHKLKEAELTGDLDLDQV